MQKLSTGVDSTLGNWSDLVNATFGPESKQAAFINRHIEEDPDGRNGEVIAEETQLLAVLVAMSIPNPMLAKIVYEQAEEIYRGEFDVQ